MVYVPVEGVEEFIYLGSKQSQRLLPTGCSTQDWTCLLSDEFFTEGMEMQFSQHQHQIHTPVPSIGNVCPALWCRNMDPLGRRHEYTGGYPHEVSATGTLCTLVIGLSHVSSAEVLQRSGLSTTGDIILTSSTLIVVWSCCTPGLWQKTLNSGNVRKSATFNRHCSPIKVLNRKLWIRIFNYVVILYALPTDHVWWCRAVHLHRIWSVGCRKDFYKI